MTRQEYDNIYSSFHLITVDDLKDIGSRTLLYGYTFNRDTFSLILDKCKIYSLLNGNEFRSEYNNNEDYLIAGDGLKRLYPEQCDYEFCKLLIEQGVQLPFTTFTDR